MNKHFQMSQKLLNLTDSYEIIDDLFKGTKRIRDKGTKYLPKEPKETDTNYSLRLNRAVLKPFLKRTILSAVGKAFIKEMALNTDSTMSILLDNCDQTGTSIETFSKDVLINALKYGVTYIMVDYPTVDRTLSLQEEREMGLFPYFVNINPTQLLDIRVSYDTGSARLSYFRFLENVSEVVDNEEKVFNQVKEIFPQDNEVVFNIYRKDDHGNEYLYSTDTITMPYIPIVPVYSNKTEPFLGEPLLTDLAYANIEHYQKSSDVDIALHMSAMPMLILSGVEVPVDPTTGLEQEITISPHSSFNVSENGDVKWLELSGTSLKTYMENIKDTEATMSLLGLELTSKRAYQETATGRMLDTVAEMSQLKAVCIDLESALQRAFTYAGDYIKFDASNTEVIIDTSLTVSPDVSVDMVISLVQQGILTPQEGLEEVKSRMLLATNPEGSRINID